MFSRRVVSFLFGGITIIILLLAHNNSYTIRTLELIPAQFRRPAQDHLDFTDYQSSIDSASNPTSIPASPYAADYGPVAAFRTEHEPLPEGTAASGLVSAFSTTTHTISAPTLAYEPLYSHPNDQEDQHPIDDLVREADKRFDDLWGARAGSVEEAAAAYRARRSRHPPPGFRQWFEYAKAHNSPVIEEFYDRIYHDLEPFWARPAQEINDFALTWPFTISIRNGKANMRVEDIMHTAWMREWENMIRQVAQFLPDVDMAFNDIDMPRLWVPWEKINEYMDIAKSTKHTNPPSRDNPIIQEFLKRPGPNLPIPPSEPQPWFNETPIWNLARRTCPPGSEGRSLPQLKPFDTPVTFPEGFPNGSYLGYVSNWTHSRSFCDNGHFGNMHGSFVHARCKTSNTTLVPLFGGCKLEGINNDILVPPAYYWLQNEEFGEIKKIIPWEDKSDTIVWRGQASGGAHNGENWTRFHRHRFIAMMNGTLVTQHLASPNRPHQAPGGRPRLPHNFPLPEPELYGLQTYSGPRAELEESLNNVSDVGFVHYLCHPWLYSQFTKGDKCAYLEPYYKIQKEVTMANQFKNKYLPDIDGTSYSGRFRAFLFSASMPIKSTVFAEWHDNRLIPWRHFVPMDLTGKDWWGIQEYFLGDRKIFEPRESRDLPGHDKVAKAIATQGAKWARQVHRRPDMVVYVYRLILEFARLCDERREQMGYVDDLLYHA